MAFVVIAVIIVWSDSVMPSVRVSYFDWYFKNTFEIEISFIPFRLCPMCVYSIYIYMFRALHLSLFDIYKKKINIPNRFVIIFTQSRFISDPYAPPLWYFQHWNWNWIRWQKEKRQYELRSTQIHTCASNLLFFSWIKRYQQWDFLRSAWTMTTTVTITMMRWQRINIEHINNAKKKNFTQTQPIFIFSFACWFCSYNFFFYFFIFARLRLNDFMFCCCCWLSFLFSFFFSVVFILCLLTHRILHIFDGDNNNKNIDGEKKWQRYPIQSQYRQQFLCL